MIGPAAAETRRPRRKIHKRDSDATRRRILQAARSDFAEHGFTGARVDRIAKMSESNVQMIYRYFGNKEHLYLAALSDMYARIREDERRLDLDALAPVKGVRRLVEFTFDYLAANPEFVAIIRNENSAGGRFVERLPGVSDSSRSLIGAVRGLLERGHANGDFTADIDATHLYVSILSLCMAPLSQSKTLSVLLSEDLDSDAWLGTQRAVAADMVVAYLCRADGTK